MTTNNIQRIPWWRANLRIILLVAATIILILEMIFSYFSLPARRAISWFDVQAVLAILIFTLAKPRMMWLAVRFQFKQIPLLYKICLCVAAYVLLLKALYFLGYFAATLFKK